jgi:excisionase family DNA binding protein
MPADPPTTQSPEVLLVPDTVAAALLGISRASLHRLRAAGRMPVPLKLGKSCRWRRDELERWVAAGAPTLAMWREIEAQSRRRGAG